MDKYLKALNFVREDLNLDFEVWKTTEQFYEKYLNYSKDKRAKKAAKYYLNYAVKNLRSQMSLVVFDVARKNTTEKKAANKHDEVLKSFDKRFMSNPGFYYNR